MWVPLRCPRGCLLNQGASLPRNTLLHAYLQAHIEARDLKIIMLIRGSWSNVHHSCNYYMQHIFITQRDPHVPLKEADPFPQMRSTSRDSPQNWTGVVRKMPKMLRALPTLDASGGPTGPTGFRRSSASIWALVRPNQVPR